MVLPAIIVTVITVVLIIMFFYSQMTEQSRMHMELRRQAGIACENTFYEETMEEKLSDAEIYTKRTATGVRAYGKRYLIMKYQGILEKKGTFVIVGTWNGIDGSGYVRYCDFIRGHEDEQ